MSHATIYADQDGVLAFINGRLAAGDQDRDILCALRSWDAIACVGHAITAEDLAAAVRYVHGMLAEGCAMPVGEVDCLNYLRRILQMEAA